MVILKVKRDTYGGEDYLKNMCCYPYKKKLVHICGYGVDPNPEFAYHQMMAVKRRFGKTSGNPLMHFMVSFDKSVTDPKTAISFSRTIALFFFDAYQTLWAVHEKKRSNSIFHAHIIVNSVSYRNGKMFHSGRKEMDIFKEYISEMTGQKCDMHFEKTPKKTR